MAAVPLSDEAVCRGLNLIGAARAQDGAGVVGAGGVRGEAADDVGPGRRIEDVDDRALDGPARSADGPGDAPSRVERERSRVDGAGAVGYVEQRRACKTDGAARPEVGQGAHTAEHSERVQPRGELAAGVEYPGAVGQCVQYEIIGVGQDLDMSAGKRSVPARGVDDRAGEAAGLVREGEVDPGRGARSGHGDASARAEATLAQVVAYGEPLQVSLDHVVPGRQAGDRVVPVDVRDVIAGSPVRRGHAGVHLNALKRRGSIGHGSRDRSGVCSPRRNTDQDDAKEDQQSRACEAGRGRMRQGEAPAHVATAATGAPHGGSTKSSGSPRSDISPPRVNGTMG